MMFNAVLWIARSGAAWRDLPKERYGSWETVYSRFCLWRDTDLLESLFIALNREADYENLSIDSTVVTAHQQSAGASTKCRCKKRGLNSATLQHIGKSSVGHTTKIHVVVDALGNPLYFQLSDGNLHDSVLAIEVLERVEIKGSNIIGDRAYGALVIRTYVNTHEATYTIPPKKNTKEPWAVDWWLYKERHLVECFFNKLKHFRHITIRYDKLVTSYLAFVYVAAIFLLTK